MDLKMQTEKQRISEIVSQQPEDASYEEIIRELAFERMVARGLADSRKGATISNDELKRRISSWKK